MKEAAAAPPAGEGEALAHVPVLAGFARAFAIFERLLVILCSLALVGASCILSYSVIARHFFQAATYWQDEASVFLIVGATFLSAAHVQARRGHVGIEALAEILPPAANRIRSFLVDLASFAFCAFFAWKSWTLFHEAWVDGQTSSSTWGPPLWVPYSLMALGMTLLSIQILLQLVAALPGGEKR
ncbi:TRAP transporter small permease [Enterovirga sp.]|uniref:TRAP transporter small permease n=1 Tax=Enterovirga sp. TaxID=2026350 RepID=UPI002D0F23E0|nr:TRAP transporter small permease [Enterovirga sp.]HMO29030.1 TRAP transporter small permease [Enterovirga sp.]